MKKILLLLIIGILLSPNVLAGCLGLQSPYTQRFVKADQLPGGCLNTCFDPQTDVAKVCGSRPGPTPDPDPPKPDVPKRAAPQTLDKYKKDSYDYMKDCLDSQEVNWGSLKSVKEKCANSHQKKVVSALKLGSECRSTCDEFGFLYEKDCDWLCTASDRRIDGWSDENNANNAVTDWENTLELGECKNACTNWSPTDCRGGYQARLCSDECGADVTRRLCPTSMNGYLNLPTRGSYLYADPSTGEFTISTKGEYQADYVNVYIGETEGNFYLISGEGKHIQGMGLHVGEPVKLKINAPVRADIIRFGNVPQGAYTAEINGIPAVVTQTNRGFDVGFEVPSTTGMKEFTMNLIRDGEVVQTIPLVADVQPPTKDLLRTVDIESKPIDYDERRDAMWELFVFMNLGFGMVLVGGLAVYFLFRKRKS